MLVEVRAVGTNVLEIAWDRALGTITAEPYQYLHTQLACLGGVDDVRVLRYSAEVTVALHARSLAAVAADVLEFLREDEEWLGWVRTGVDEYDVYWLE